jgi:succinate dehydrogenase / fumarate reductase cytochrome b subunit
MTRYTLLTSFFNRLMGLGQSLGLLVLIYWLMAIASGSKAYGRAEAVLSLSVFKLIYAGLLVAFCYHLVAGIRHLVWDTGRGLERAQSQRSAYIVVAVSVLLVIALGYWLFIAQRNAS